MNGVSMESSVRAVGLGGQLRRVCSETCFPSPASIHLVLVLGALRMCKIINGQGSVEMVLFRFSEIIGSEVLGRHLHPFFGGTDSLDGPAKICWSGPMSWAGEGFSWVSQLAKRAVLS